MQNDFITKQDLWGYKRAEERVQANVQTVMAKLFEKEIMKVELRAHRWTASWHWNDGKDHEFFSFVRSAFSTNTK